MKEKLRDWLLRDYRVPKSEGVQLVTISILTGLIACLLVGELLVDLKATSLPLIATLLFINTILLFYARRFGQSKVIGHIQLLVLYIMFQVSFFTLPNTFHVFMYWMPSIPLLAFIFGDLRSSHIWLGVILVTLVIDTVYGMSVNGEAYIAEIPYLPYAVAATIFTITLVACFSLLYNLLGRSYGKLSIKNREVLELINQLKELNGSLEGTVKERTRDIEERNERLKQYAFMNSHMVRAPLANIIGAVSHLEEEGDQARVGELMDMIKVSAARLDDVIKEVGKSLSD